MYSEIKAVMEFGALNVNFCTYGSQAESKRVHIYAWTAAWGVISARTFISLFESLPPLTAFLRDWLIVLSLYWHRLFA